METVPLSPLNGVASKQRHLPMQNPAKIRPMTSSGVTRPQTEPSVSRAVRMEAATSSGASITPEEVGSESRAASKASRD